MQRRPKHARLLVTLGATIALMLLWGAASASAAGTYTVNVCGAAAPGYQSGAFSEFANRGMRWKRACNPDGPPTLRGLVTSNVLRSGRVKTRRPVAVCVRGAWRDQPGQHEMAGTNVPAGLPVLAPGLRAQARRNPGRYKAVREQAGEPRVPQGPAAHRSPRPTASAPSTVPSTAPTGSCSAPSASASRASPSARHAASTASPPTAPWSPLSTPNRPPPRSCRTIRSPAALGSAATRPSPTAGSTTPASSKPRRW